MMMRYGMGPTAFAALASLIARVLAGTPDAPPPADGMHALRARFTQMRCCFE